MVENVPPHESPGEFLSYRMSRRRLLQILRYGAAGTAGASFLAACGEFKLTGTRASTARLHLLEPRHPVKEQDVR